MKAEIRVPHIGASTASIGRWFKRLGDPVNLDEPVVEIEADGKTLELLASATGVLSEVLVTDGESVKTGTLLGKITEYSIGTDSLTR